MSYLDPVDLLTPAQLARIHEQVDDERRSTVDAVVMWLCHAPTRTSRIELATKLMVASLYVQAGLLGLVECSRCGDRGCDWCAPAWPRGVLA